jgi:hypothetical protein
MIHAIFSSNETVWGAEGGGAIGALAQADVASASAMTERLTPR